MPQRMKADETYSSLANGSGGFPFFVFSPLRSCFFFDLLLLLRPSGERPWLGGLGLDACLEDLALLSGSEGIHPFVKGAASRRVCGRGSI